MQKSGHMTITVDGHNSRLLRWRRLQFAGKQADVSCELYRQLEPQQQPLPAFGSSMFPAVQRLLTEPQGSHHKPHEGGCPPRSKGGQEVHGSAKQPPLSSLCCGTKSCHNFEEGGFGSATLPGTFGASERRLVAGEAPKHEGFVRGLFSA